MTAMNPFNNEQFSFKRAFFAARRQSFCSNAFRGTAQFITARLQRLRILEKLIAWSLVA
jgi:hypothetical protein